MNQEMSPNPQFIENIVAGLTYWQEQTAQLDDLAIKELDAQRQNLLRIVRYGLVLPQTWPVTATLIIQTFHFIERRGYWQEWIPVLQKAINWCADDRTLKKFKLLTQLGQLYRSMRQMAPALEAFEDAKTIAQQLGDVQLLAESHYHLSELYLRQREYTKAEEYGSDALSKFTSIKAEKRWFAITLGTLGELSRFQGDLPLAEKRLSQAVLYWRLLNKPVHLARALNDLAVTFLAAEKLEQVQTCYMEVVTLLEPTDNNLDKAMVQINLGVVHFRQTQWDEAEAAFRKADSFYLRHSPHIYYKALVSNNLGNVLLKQERMEEAISYLQNAVTLWQQADDKVELANTLSTLADARVAQGRRSDAVSLYEEAIGLLCRFPDDARAREMLEKCAAQREVMQAAV